MKRKYETRKEKMKKLIFAGLLVASTCALAEGPFLLGDPLSFGAKTALDSEALKSPGGQLKLEFAVDAKGPTWTLESADKTLVKPSRLGLAFAGMPAFGDLKVVAKTVSSADSTWTNRLGRRETVRDRYNELSVLLEETSVAAGCKARRRWGLVFRAYDEGVAFRYTVPAQPEIPGFQLMQDLTEWRFADDPTVWATEYARHQNSQERPFARKRLGTVPAKSLVGMPVLVETGGKTLALAEAALANWAGMFYRAKEGMLSAELSPLPPSAASTEGVAVIRTTPAESPWRVTLVGKDELDLLAKGDLILNLNPPPEEGLDFSWVRPGASSWDWWVESNNSLSTDLTLRLVDFAAEMGWPYHTVDGGWYGFARRPNHGPDVKIECRPGFDLGKIVEHAKAKGVGIWVWLHWEALADNGVEETFAKLERWGVKGVKIDFHDRQDQKMVCWFEKVSRCAAQHRIMVNFHGAFKPTGTERTWPNCLTREGVRGNEMQKFGASITPEHCATLPFTRYLLGPGDFTPGAFANVFSKDFVPQGKRGHRYGDESDRRPIWAEAIGTRAYSIAQCVAFDSPLMTLCDWPERYRGAAGVAALKSLPTVWKATRPVAGKCGEHYAVVREAPNGDFYFAAFTVKRRNIDLKLDFLGEGDWRMEVFADDPELTPGDAKELACGVRKVRKGESVSFGLYDEGGAVAVFRRLSRSER